MDDLKGKKMFRHKSTDAHLNSLRLLTPCTRSAQTQVIQKSQHGKADMGCFFLCYLYIIDSYWERKNQLSSREWQGIYQPHSRASRMLRVVNQYKLDSTILVLFCSFLEREEAWKMGRGRDNIGYVRILGKIREGKGKQFLVLCRSYVSRRLYTRRL